MLPPPVPLIEQAEGLTHVRPTQTPLLQHSFIVHDSVNSAQMKGAADDAELGLMEIDGMLDGSLLGTDDNKG